MPQRDPGLQSDQLCAVQVLDTHCVYLDMAVVMTVLTSNTDTGQERRPGKGQTPVPSVGQNVTGEGRRHGSNELGNLFGYALLDKIYRSLRAYHHEAGRNTHVYRSEYKSRPLQLQLHRRTVRLDEGRPRDISFVCVSRSPVYTEMYM